MEHWSVSSANSPNRRSTREKDRKKESERETRRAGNPLPLTLHPSIPPSFHTFLPVPKSERVSERGRKAAECPTYMNTTVLTWIVMPLCEQLEWLLCAFFLMPICHRKTYGMKACGYGQRLPQEAIWDLTTARMPTAGATHEKTQHLIRLCIRGTLTCTHIPIRASHTSSTHIPRAHEAAWALMLSLLYLFFFLWTHSRHTFTNLPHSQFKC